MSLKPFEDLIEHFKKESRIYAKLAKTTEGARPSDASPENLEMAYSAASYSLAAKMLGDVVKKNKEMNFPKISVIEQTWDEFYPDRKRFDTMSEETREEWYAFFSKYEELKAANEHLANTK